MRITYSKSVSLGRLSLSLAQMPEQTDVWKKRFGRQSQPRSRSRTRSGLIRRDPPRLLQLIAIRAVNVVWRPAFENPHNARNVSALSYHHRDSLRASSVPRTSHPKMKGPIYLFA